MPYLQLDFDAIPDIEAAGFDLKIDPDKVQGVLSRLWLHCWRTRSQFIPIEKVAAIAKLDHKRLIASLVTFGFLEIQGDRVRVRGTSRYVRMLEGAQKGGLAKSKLELEKSTTSAALPPAPPLPGEAQGQGRSEIRDPRSELQHPPTPRKRGPRKVSSGRRVELPFGEDGRPIGGERNDRVFAFWSHHLRHPDALLDDGREKLIDGAFALGYTEDQIFTAIIGCACSPYHQGKNPENKVYDKLGLILRDGEHIDDFIARTKKAPLTREGYRSSG